jgi:DnaJ-class molecular chaperone
MSISKMKKCPSCKGLGICDDGSECPDCEGAGEISFDETPDPTNCWPMYPARR